MPKPTPQTLRPDPTDGDGVTEAPAGIARRPRSRAYLLLATVYLALAVCGSLVPFDFIHVPLDQAIDQFPRIDPMHVTLRSWSDLGANILLFVPLTFLAMGALTGQRRRRGQWLIGAAVVPAAAALSATIEFVQIYLPLRTTSQSDILAETFGGILGVVLWLWRGRRITQQAREYLHHPAGNHLATRALLVYLLFVALCLLMPFDLTLSLGQTYRKLKSWRVTVVPFTDLRQGWLFALAWKAALMVPVGYLLLIHRPQRRRRFLGAVAWGVGFALAAETAQLLTASRLVSTTDVIIYVAGILIGATVGLRFGPRQTT